METILFVIVIGSILCFIFIVILVIVAFFVSKPNLWSEQHHIPKLPDIESNGGGSFFVDPSLQQVSMPELVAATNNFHPSGIIGNGGFGLVYRAVLSSTTVAVKKFDLDGSTFQGLREFRAEIETLAGIRHPNVVGILGFCASGPDRILVYEFVDRGSLDDWLHLDDDPNRPPLSWRTRVSVVKGVAEGLAYMHGLEKPIVHRDINAGNVLLGPGFEARIADFGLARRIEGGADSHFSTQAAGTTGYMPPEYRAGYTAATVKVDVYSFGVLMLEVATARRPNWPIKEKEGGGEVRLGVVEWVKRKVADCEGMKTLDERIPAREVAVDELNDYFRLASVCTSDRAEDRPRMKDVVEILNRIESNRKTSSISE